jgi:hypothetical protein
MSAPIGYAPVPLPSRGLLYGDKVPDGIVYVRKLKVTEEVAIQSSGSGLALVNATVGACVKLPEGMNHLDLLMTDRLALLVALRVYTFGPTYGYGFKCPACGAKNTQNFNLGELTSKKAEDGLVEPIPVDLPDCGRKVGLRFLRGKDEASIAAVSKRIAAQSNDLGDSSYIMRKVLQIVTIDGVETDQATKERFVRDLTMVDSQAMSDAIDDKEPGIDLRIFPECKACGFQTEMGLPFSIDFFRAARRTA